MLFCGRMKSVLPYTIIVEGVAGVAKLVDAHGLGPCSARSGGSSPLPGTMYFWVGSKN